MVMDQISRKLQRYKQLTGTAPDRIYLGLNQVSELQQQGELKPNDRGQITVSGMQAFKVHEANHLYMCGGLESE